MGLSSVMEPPVPLCPSFAASSSSHGVPLLSFSSDPIFIEWKMQECSKERSENEVFTEV